MNTSISSTALWTGKIIQGLLCLFLLFDSGMKIIKQSKSIEATKQIGLPESCIQLLGFYLLIATILFIIPRTSMHGILMLIAYLGGATAITFLNKPEDWSFLFPVVFALLILLSLYLQNINFRNILSFKQLNTFH